MHLPHRRRHRHRPPARRALARTGLTLLATTALALGGVLAAAPASAHDQLESTSPADGASVDGPRAVSLTFGEAVLDVPTANRVVVTGPDGDVEGTLAVDGAVMTLTFADPLPGGSYRVQWRAASDDGHPVSGRFAFTSTAPRATATATASPSTSSGAATTSPAPTTTTLDAEPAADEAGGPGRVLVLGLLLLGALCAGTIVAAKRRAREGPTEDGS
ncbi:hypothetical protein GCM10027446_31950 [Angustibacter peucedani]